jgi:hypothetical protein
LQTRADWFSLLLQGERRTGTANSDSHHLRDPVGLPRNYVAADDASIAAFDQDAFVSAVKRGVLYGTTGPLLEVSLGDTPLGGLHAGGKGTLHVAVRAADWVPVNRLEVYANGTRIAREDAAQRSDHEIAIDLAQDAFVTVEVWGEPDERYQAIAPGFTPYAFTNPIFVDADGDGAFRAPGLPTALPASILTPLASD